MIFVFFVLFSSSCQFLVSLNSSPQVKCVCFSGSARPAEQELFAFITVSIKVIFFQHAADEWKKSKLGF